MLYLLTKFQSKNIRMKKSCMIILQMIFFREKKQNQNCFADIYVYYIFKSFPNGGKSFDRSPFNESFLIPRDSQKVASIDFLVIIE